MSALVESLAGSTADPVSVELAGTRFCIVGDNWSVKLLGELGLVAHSLAEVQQGEVTLADFDMAIVLKSDLDVSQGSVRDWVSALNMGGDQATTFLSCELPSSACGDGICAWLRERLPDWNGTLPIPREAGDDLGEELLEDIQEHSVEISLGNRLDIAIPPRIVIPVSEIEVKPIEWLWTGRLPVGKCVILDGDPGTGKSTITADFAARVSTGRAFPFCPLAGRQPGAVLMLNAEDGYGDTIRPRLEAAEADLDRVFVRSEEALHPYLPCNMELLQRDIECTGASLVVIDPMTAYLSDSVNAYRDQDVRRVLRPLKEVAEKWGCTVLLVRHLNKQAGNTNATYRGGGSIGIIGAVRVGLLAGVHPENAEQRVLAVSKTNLAKCPASIRYSLSQTPSGVARVNWEAQEAFYASDLLVEQSSEDRSASEEAQEFLRIALADGALPASELLKQASEVGISGPTLKRAKRLIAKSVKSGMDGGWLWELVD